MCTPLRSYVRCTTQPFRSAMNATSEAIDAVCEEFGLDADNILSREMVAFDVIECARLERDLERICEMVVKELKSPTAAA